MRVCPVNFNAFKGVYNKAYNTAQPKIQPPAADTVSFKNSSNIQPLGEKPLTDEEIILETNLLRTTGLNRFHELRTTICEDKHHNYKTTKNSTRDITRVYEQGEDNSYALVEYNEKGKPVRKTEFTHFSFSTEDGTPEIAQNGIPIGTPAITSIEEYTRNGIVRYNYDVLYPDCELKNEVLYDYKENKNDQSAAKKVTYDWRNENNTEIAIGYRKSNGKETAKKVVKF